MTAATQSLNSFFEVMIRRERNNDNDPHVVGESFEDSDDEMKTRKVEMLQCLGMKELEDEGGKVGGDLESSGPSTISPIKINC